jgi:hypothetical protein
MCSSHLVAASISLFDAAVCKLSDNHSFQSYNGILVLFFLKSPEKFILLAMSLEVQPEAAQA